MFDPTMLPDIISIKDGYFEVAHLTSEQYRYWKREIDKDLYLAMIYSQLEVNDDEEEMVTRQVQDNTIEEFFFNFRRLTAATAGDLYNAVKKGDFKPDVWADILKPYIPGLALAVHDFGTYMTVVFERTYSEYRRHMNITTPQAPK